MNALLGIIIAFLALATPLQGQRPGDRPAIPPSRDRSVDRVMERGSQRVEVHVTPHGGGSTTTVCLESAAGVSGGKRLVLEAEHESTTLSVGRGNPGPHCALVSAARESIRVRLDYTRLLVFSQGLGEMEFSREDGAGRTITFRWVRE